MNKYIYAIFRSLKVFLHVLRRGHYSPSAKKISGFGNNKECYILGNGPSLVKEFAKAEQVLANNVTFVVNNFAKSEYYTKIKPAFYVLLDPVFFDDRATLDNGVEIGERSIIDVIIQKNGLAIIYFGALRGARLFERAF